MKKFTLLFAFLIASIGFSQEVIQSFEAAGAVNGDPFGGMAAPTVLTGTGTNTTQVLEIVGNTATEVWQGINLNLIKNVELTTTKTMSIDVKSATPITFLVKVNGGIAGAPEAAAEVTHNGDGTWQTISFTFNTALDGKAATANGVYSGFVIHTYWKAGETSFTPNVTKPARTFYVDNIFGIAAAENTCANSIQDGDETGVDCGGSCSPCVNPPTSAAPTPPARNASDVISLYSGAYINVASNFDQGWCANDPGPGAAAVQEVMIATNPTNAWLNNNCQGIDLNTAIDASTFTRLHVDVYIDETNFVGKVFNMKFVKSGGAALEINFNNASTPPLVGGQWISIDVPVNLAAFTDLKQFGITNNNFGKSWYDNLYFYKGIALSTEDFAKTSFRIFPNPTQDSWTVKTQQETIASIKVFDILGKNVISLTPNADEAKIDASNLKSGLYFAHIKTISGISSLKLVKK